MEWKKCIWQWKANKFPVNDEDTLFKTWPAISGRQYVAGYRPLPSLRSTYPACDKDRVVESIFLTAPKGVAVCLPLPAAMAWCLHPQVHPVCGASGVRWVVVFRKLLMMLLLPSTTRFFFYKIHFTSFSKKPLPSSQATCPCFFFTGCTLLSILLCILDKEAIVSIGLSWSVLHDLHGCVIEWGI